MGIDQTGIIQDESGDFIQDESGAPIESEGAAIAIEAAAPRWYIPGQMLALLPQGAAWARDAGTSLRLFIEGLAAEIERIHERAVDLMAEMDPSRSLEMLREWETVWGLPDPCTGALSTLQERRAALMARIMSVGGQSPGYFIRLAATLGYTITITENVGGDPTVWRVNAPTTTVRWFRAGRSRAGEQIRSWGNDLLECGIEAAAPAHLTLLFGYGG